ncbi:MAG: family transporter [Microbacteriaceae bacterium]|nr:family transporter [Microbacteriaceae bacterium]
MTTASVKATSAAVARREPFPLGLFGMTLGLAGLAGGWVGAIQLLGAPRWPAELLYGLSAALWLIFSIVYFVRALSVPGRFRADFREPATAPFTAFIPVVGILLVSHYAQYFPVVGEWVTVAFVIVLLVLIGYLMATWLGRGLGQDTLHGGYFIAVVAGPFIASIGLTTVGLHEGALMAFGAGIFFWLSFGTVVMARHLTGGPAPAPVVPALSAFLAAPSSAGVAWLVMHPGAEDEVEQVLAGVVVVMLLVQLLLIPQYRKLKFGFQFWIFTFPVAASANFMVRWVAGLRFEGWQIVAWAALALASAFILAVGIGSLAIAGRMLRGASRG